MQLGLSLTPVAAGGATAQSLVDQMITAAGAGAQSIFLGDRAPDDSVSGRSNVMLLAAALHAVPEATTVGSFYLAADWPQHMVLLTVRTLVELAEQRRARPALTIALGRPTPETTQPGAPTRVQRLEALLDALRNDPVAGRAELWIAAERGNALVRAGRRADVWLGNAHTSNTGLQEQAQQVQQAAVEAARTAPVLAFRRDVVCEPTDEAAQRVADEAIAGGYRGGKVPRSSLLVGSPQGCAEQIAALGSLGFTAGLVRPVSSGEHALETLRRFFSEVGKLL